MVSSFAVVRGYLTPLINLFKNCRCEAVSPLFMPSLRHGVYSERSECVSRNDKQTFWDSLDVIPCLSLTLRFFTFVLKRNLVAYYKASWRNGANIFLASSACEDNTWISQGEKEGIYPAAFRSPLFIKERTFSFSRISFHIMANGSFGAVAICTSGSSLDLTFDFDFGLGNSRRNGILSCLLPLNR